MKTKAPIRKWAKNDPKLVFRVSTEQKQRLDQILKSLKVSDSKRKWNFQNIMRASLETFIQMYEDNEKKKKHS